MDREKQIQELLPDLQMNAEYIPQDIDNPLHKNVNAWLRWKITLTNNNNSMEIDYSQGLGYIPDFEYNNRTLSYNDYISQVLKTGKYKKGENRYRFSIYGKSFNLPEPNLLDVLNALVTDSEVLDHPNFESWADEFGYEIDSQKTKQIYHLCLSNALKFQYLVGAENISKIREILADY